MICDSLYTIINNAIHAVPFLVVVAAVNVWSMRWTTWVQDIFSVAKLAALAIIIIAGMIELGKGGSKVSYHKREYSTSLVYEK